jgi:hypothetical protein
LLIAIVILGFIAAILFGFVTTGGNLFRNVSARTSEQMDSQTALAQMRDYIVNCNGEVKWEDGSNTLTVTNIDVGGVAGRTEKYEFKRVTDKIQLTYTPSTGTADSAILVDKVTNFTVSAPDTPSGKYERNSDGSYKLSDPLDPNSKIPILTKVYIVIDLDLGTYDSKPVYIKVRNAETTINVPAP